MHSTSTLLVLCLPLTLLAGCPSDPADDGAADSDSSTTQADPPPPETDTETTPPPETDTETTPPPETDTETDTDTDTDGQSAECACILDEEYGDVVNSPHTPSSPTCGEALCPTVVGDCGFVPCGAEEPFMLADPAALECALMALRDRSPGIVTWSWSELGGQYDDAGYVLVNDDGTAVRRNWSFNDLDYTASDAVFGELPPPDHFDACLSEADDAARFDCLRGPLGSSLEICDEGWYYSDI